MPFKKGLREVLAPILAFWPLPTLYHSKRFTELLSTIYYWWIKGGLLKLEKQWREGGIKNLNVIIIIIELPSP